MRDGEGGREGGWYQEREGGIKGRKGRIEGGKGREGGWVVSMEGGIKGRREGGSEGGIEGGRHGRSGRTEG